MGTVGCMMWLVREGGDVVMLVVPRVSHTMGISTPTLPWGVDYRKSLFIGAQSHTRREWPPVVRLRLVLRWAPL